MAIAATASTGTFGDKSGATNGASVTVAGANIPAGSLVVVWFAVDNNGTSGASSVSAVNDNAGNPNYTQLALINRTAGNVASDGVTVGIYASVVTNALTIGNTINVVFSPNTTAKCVAYQVFTGVTSVTGYGLQSSSGTGTSYTSNNSSANVNSGDLVLAVAGNESATVPAADADVAGGAWLGGTVTTAGSGGDVTKMALRYAYKIPTTTELQAFNGSTGASTDWAAAVVALSAAATGPSAAISPAIFVLTGVALTGAATGSTARTLTNVNYVFTPVALVRSVGGVSASISPVNFALAPTSLTATSVIPDQAASISPAIFNLQPVALSKTVGDSARSLTPANFVLSPVALTQTIGNISRTLTPVSFVLSPVALARSIGNTTSAVSPAIFGLSAVGLVGSGGNTATTITPVAFSLTAIALTGSAAAPPLSGSISPVIFSFTAIRIISGYTPSDWGTVLGDYDFSKTSTITATGGDVSSVSPSSGSFGSIAASGVEQPKTGIRTQNSLNVLDFDGNDKLILDIPDRTMPLTVAVVYCNDNPSKDTTVFGDSIEIYCSGGFYYMLSNSSFINTGVLVTNKWTVLVGVFNGSSSELWIDGIRVWTGSLVSDSIDLNFVSVGNYKSSGYGVDGGMGQITYFDGVVSNPSGLSGALRDKWVPSGVDFASISPVNFSFTPVALTKSVGSTSTTLVPVTYPLVPVALGITLGAVSRSVTPVIFALVPQPLSGFTPVAGTGNIFPAIFTLSPVALTRTIGTVTRSISPAIYIFTGVALTRSVGGISRSITTVQFHFLAVSLNATSGGGKLNVWDGDEWVEKPTKYWTGSVWVAKPMKVWTGSSWELV